MATKKTYDLAFSLGTSCSVSQALRAAGLQFASFPMDWVASPGVMRSAEVVASNFAHWIDREALELVDVRRGSGFNTRIYRNRITGFGFVHEFGDFQRFAESYPKVVEMYGRRISRLYELINRSSRILMVYLELPFRACAPYDDIREARRRMTEKYPGKTIDILYFYEDPASAKPHVVLQEDGMTVVSLDYRQFDHGKITHFVRAEGVTAYLRDNIAVLDYRTPEERASHQMRFESREMSRWGRKGSFRSLMNRWAFRVFRHLEKYLMAQGIVQREGPLWFADQLEGCR